MYPTSPTTPRLVLAGLVAFGLLVGACGDDDADSAAPKPIVDSDDVAEVIEVHTVDFAFEDLPESVPAGTRLTLVNDSAVELHELVALRIPDDETRSVEELLALPEEELGAMMQGPPAAVLLAAPGGEQVEAIGDGTLTEPGRYAIVCFIPTGVDPDVYLKASAGKDGPPEIDGAGPPHVVHGMHAELTVT